MSALISRASSTVQKRMWKIAEHIPKLIAYIKLFAAPYGHYPVGVVDTIHLVLNIQLC